MGSLFIMEAVTKDQCIPLFSAFSLKVKKMIFTPMCFNQTTVHALIDSGALVNCLSEAEYANIETTPLDGIIKEMPPPLYNLQVGNRDVEQPSKTVLLKLRTRYRTNNSC